MLGIIHFLFVFLFHDLNGFLIAFIVLAITSLYQDYKVVTFTGVLELLSLTYGCFSGRAKMYGSFYDLRGLAIVIFCYTILIVIMVIQSLFAERVLNDNRRIISDLKDSIVTLKNFSSDLQENINVTGDISEEVTAAFEEISSNVESQVDVLANIHNVVEEETDEIKRIDQEANSMNNLSDQNLAKAKDVREYIKTLI